MAATPKEFLRIVPYVHSPSSAHMVTHAHWNEAPLAGTSPLWSEADADQTICASLATSGPANEKEKNKNALPTELMRQTACRASPALACPPSPHTAPFKPRLHRRRPRPLGCWAACPAQLRHKLPLHRSSSTSLLPWASAAPPVPLPLSSA